MLISGAGSPNVSTTTGAPGPGVGTYSLTGFGTGSYTVTATKIGGQNGYITSFDAARITQHVTALNLFTNDNQRVTADVSNNGVITSNDAALVARYVSGVGAPLGLTGIWRFFIPPGPTFPVGASATSRTYPSVTSDISGEDYIGLLLGDVTGNWMNTGARPAARRQTPEAEGNGPERVIAVELPNVVWAADKDIVFPVNVQGIANKDVISYEVDLRYDPSVIQPSGDVVDLKETVSRGLSVVANASEPGLLRIVVYGPLPIREDGILLNLRFIAVGAPGTFSPLVFERIMFNEGGPKVIVTVGQVELSEPAPNKVN